MKINDLINVIFLCREITEYGDILKSLDPIKDSKIITKVVNEIEALHKQLVEIPRG